MAGILTALAISWILLYLFEKKSLLALGILPAGERLKQFVIGFAFTLIICLCVKLLESALKSSTWLLNENISVSRFFNMTYWDLKSVLSEELVFRGAILYILIKQIGNIKGAVISAIAFGIYHWFSFGILGNVVPMIVVFTGTGIMGYAFALAFIRTQSIALPVGLHLGWNFTNNTIFSNGPLGNGIILLENNKNISDYFSLIGLWVVPLIILIFVAGYVPKNNISTME